MINLLLGAPGGGKSYEACVYHVLPALESGRKVVTNLPLSVQAFADIDARFPALIELRTQSLKNGARAFAAPEDYGDSWKHPVSGVGPLYVIDECHFAMPVGATDRAVEEWFSMHRHQNADVLLISQSYGKLSKPIRDLVQIVYRVRKNIAFGSSGSYTRKVQDGLRGEVVNTSMRRYEKKHFKLYRSHTQGGAAAELNASDVRPMWRSPIWIGAAVLFALPIIGFSTGYIQSPLKPAIKPEYLKVRNVPTRTTTQATTTGAASASEPTVVQPVAPPPDPLAAYGVHYLGSMTQAGRRVDMVALSQNGVIVRQLHASELTAIGYTFDPVSPCFAWLRRDGFQRVVICDGAKVSGAVPSMVGSAKVAGQATGVID